MSEGRSLELFFVDGRPDGLLTAEVFNWTGSVNWVGKASHNTAYARRFEELKDAGVIKITADEAIFTQDYAFSSPSAASAIVADRADNGRTSWKHEISGQTYAEWEEAQLEKLDPAP